MLQNIIPSQEEQATIITGFIKYEEPVFQTFPSRNHKRPTEEMTVGYALSAQHAQNIIITDTHFFFYHHFVVTTLTPLITARKCTCENKRHSSTF